MTKTSLTKQMKAQKIEIIFRKKKHENVLFFIQFIKESKYN
jgi:hypothetical protein